MNAPLSAPVLYWLQRTKLERIALDCLCVWLIWQCFSDATWFFFHLCFPVYHRTRALPSFKDARRTSARPHARDHMKPETYSTPNIVRAQNRFRFWSFPGDRDLCEYDWRPFFVPFSPRTGFGPSNSTMPSPCCLSPFSCKFQVPRNGNSWMANCWTIGVWRLTARTSKQTKIFQYQRCAQCGCCLCKCMHKDTHQLLPFWKKNDIFLFCCGDYEAFCSHNNERSTVKKLQMTNFCCLVT